MNSDSDSYRGEIGENFMRMQASPSVCLPSFGPPPRVARYINVQQFCVEEEEEGVYLFYYTLLLSYGLVLSFFWRIYTEK